MHKKSTGEAALEQHLSPADACIIASENGRST